jgi:hypothetical protein
MHKGGIDNTLRISAFIIPPAPRFCDGVAETPCFNLRDIAAVGKSVIRPQVQASAAKTCSPGPSPPRHIGFAKGIEFYRGGSWHRDGRAAVEALATPTLPRD